VSYSTKNYIFAPKEAADWLTGNYVNTQSERIHLHPDDFGVERIGHFVFFKPRFKNTILTSIVLLVRTKKEGFSNTL